MQSLTVNDVEYKLLLRLRQLREFGRGHLLVTVDKHDVYLEKAEKEKLST